MFKVECPGCKAPYQVDERRVPQSGLKMRCPKCGTSFQVDPPPADPRDASPGASVLGASLGFGTESSQESAPPDGGRPALPKRKPALKGTMIGVAPPRAGGGAPARPAIPVPKPAAAPPVRPAPGASDPFADLDLPSAVAPQKPAAARDPFGEMDLPSPAAAKGAPPRFGAPTRPQTQQPAAQKPPRPGVPRPIAPAAGAKAPFGDLDLSDNAGWEEASADDADLPAVGTGRADLPMTAARGHGTTQDLPIAKPAGAPPKPAPRAAPAQAARAAPAAFGELDLPSISTGADLPSLSSGVDLPSPSIGLDLPSVSTSSTGGAARGIPGFGELDLPILGGELPVAAAGLPVHVAAGLPSPAAALPTPAGALPMNAAGLPTPTPSGLPAALGGPSSFEEEDDSLSESIPLTDDPFEGPGAAPLSMRPAAGGLRNNTPDPFGAVDPFESGGDPFGAGGDPFGGSSADPFGGHLDGELSPAAPKSLRAPPVASVRPNGAEPAPRVRDDSELVRQGGGGTAYGEVNLDDGAMGDTAGFEGDLAQSKPPPPQAEVGSEFAGLPEEVALPDARRVRPDAALGSAAQEIVAKKKRRRVRIAVAFLATTVLAGGALTLVPALGPFGAYFIIDQVKRGDYERSLGSAVESAHKSLGNDTSPDADTALSNLESAIAGARRFKPLAAYSAFVGFDKALRFGSEPSIYAKAKVTIDELADVHGVPQLELARAAKAGVDGELAKARQLLDQLALSDAKNVDVTAVRGEVELRARDVVAALTAWKAAAEIEKTPRTLYGLARATLASGDGPGAEKLAEQVQAQNAHHVGAALLLAENAWRNQHDEPKATKLLDQVQRDTQIAGPEERIVTQTLLGEIHLSRGRSSQAEHAFEEAIKTADMLKANALAARALGGLGEVLFRAGRYSQAIARYKAAAQADPDDLQAQIGVGKSSLLLERVDDARDMLTKLKKAHGASMDVDYWYGRVTESLGDRKEAEAAYRDAITNGKGNPETIQAYISLAGVESASGELEGARATLAEAQNKLPASTALHKALGKVAMSQGRYADGLDAFQRALALDPEDVDAKFLVGTALVRQRQFDKALEIFDAVGKVDRDFPGLALERGVLFQESGRTEEALREYESALAKAPNDPDLMLKVGCGKADAGDGVEAEKILKKVLEQRQTSAETYFCLGRALMAKHDLGESIKAFERAIQIDPNHAEYWLYVGWASNEAGAIAKASTALKKALDLDQGLADAYWQRGVLRVRQTRPKDAIDDLMKALELRPSRVEAHADLALAYYDLGKEDLALGEWQKAIAAKPNEPTWRFHYGKLLSLRLQNGAAAEQLKKAIDLAEADTTTTQPWIPEAHRLAALSLGASPAAIAHWQAFLKTGAVNSPYRNEAKAALKRLGQPWDDD
jgi:predicted Zn finger-like uncharacterized protein